jgi:ribosome-associated protein
METPDANHRQTPGVQAIEAKELARQIAEVIDEKQGADIQILDVSGPLVIADHFVVASARNPRHARAIASEVVYAMKQLARPCRHAAGNEGESNWVLLDFDDVVVHIFQDEARAFYDLESLWADVPRLEFTPARRAAGDASVWESLPESTYPDSGGTL